MTAQRDAVLEEAAKHLEQHAVRLQVPMRNRPNIQDETIKTMFACAQSIRALKSALPQAGTTVAPNGQAAGEQSNGRASQEPVRDTEPAAAAPVPPDRAESLLRQLVKDCQDDLAVYLVPDSGISDHEVISTLLGRLDGQQSRDALEKP